ncbi:transmembrane amino acid transporter protein-domain-containing protein [Mrakia frigida]|uniref:transmembrane amino acid transporter protein-domain-containing protein n=1 Tax=Mrakia frigida TaxID=29902 RepID=UPI003FCC0EA5
MSHAYSAIPSSTTKEPTVLAPGIGPDSPLLGATHVIQDIDEDQLDLAKHAGGSASVFSSVSNLANTILGTGMLAFPSAFASIGIVPGLISCATSGFLAFSGLYFLSLCAAKVQPARKSSFNAVSMLTFGKGATVFFDLAIAIKCFGVSISYLIIIKTLTPTALTTIYTIVAPSSPVPAFLKSGPLWLLISMAVNVPLSFFKRLDSLRFTSQAALVFVLYMLSVVVVFYFHRPGDIEPAGPIEYFRWSRGAIGSFPVQVFAYTCAQNLFPVYNELKHNSQKRMNLVIGTSIGSATVIYEVMALAGYLTFGSKVGSNIIAMYPNSSLFVAIGRLGIVLMVLFSYPLQAHPCRLALDKVISTIKSYSHLHLDHHRKTAATPPTPASAVESLNEDDEDDTLEDDFIPEELVKEMSQTRYIALTVGILLGGLIIALLVDDLEIVLSFVGATGSTTISFILPGLFYFSLFRRVPGTSPLLKWGSAALAVYGICVMCFCLTYNIIKVSQGRDST